MTTASDISVLLVNWNGKSLLEECLRSLETQTERGFHVVVVDNGSIDGSLEMLASTFPWVHVIPTGENLGFAEGCNRGLEHARTEWIFALNNDTVADPRLIEVLVRAANEVAPDVGMLQARMLFKSRPTHTNSTGIFLTKNGGAGDRDFDKPRNDQDMVREVFCPTGGAALYRRAMLDAVALDTGTFDREFFMYWEDVDLGWRCQLGGWRCLYLPDALVFHAYQASSAKRGRSFASNHGRRNRLRTLLKNASWGFFLRTTPRTALDVLRLLFSEGPMGVARLYGVAKGELAQRSSVGAIARKPRREVEKTWAGR